MRTTPHRLHRLVAGFVGVTLTGGLLGLSAAPADEASVHVVGSAPAATGSLVGLAPAPEPDALAVPAEGGPPAPPPVPTAQVPVEPVASPSPAPRPTPAPAPAPPDVAEAAPTPAPAPPATPRAAARTTAPAPEPQPAPPPPPPTTAPAETREARVHRAFELGVPAAWRDAIDVRFELIEGDWSWAHTDGLIQVAIAHADGHFEALVDLLAHEFGHMVAFRYGTREYVGAPPEGWPAPEHRPEEAWADCVQRAFTGRATGTHGQAPCEGERLSWAASWLAQGPGAHSRSG